VVGPDGPVEREQWAEERSEREYDELDREEKLADEAVDESLLDIAEARMAGYWLDRVTNG
jgi:hypothetical protein